MSTMIPADLLPTLRDLSAGRAPFAPDQETGRIHRQLVMRGLASCRVEFLGQFISITDAVRRELSAPAGIYQEMAT